MERQLRRSVKQLLQEALPIVFFLSCLGIRVQSLTLAQGRQGSIRVPGFKGQTASEQNSDSASTLDAEG